MSHFPFGSNTPLPFPKSAAQGPGEIRRSLKGGSEASWVVPPPPRQPCLPTGKVVLEEVPLGEGAWSTLLLPASQTCGTAGKKDTPGLGGGLSSVLSVCLCLSLNRIGSNGKRVCCPHMNMMHAEGRPSNIFFSNFIYNKRRNFRAGGVVHWNCMEALRSAVLTNVTF